MISMLILGLGLGTFGQVVALFASSKLALANEPAIDVTTTPAGTVSRRETGVSRAAEPAWETLMRGM
jgi:hypothetical protein